MAACLFASGCFEAASLRPDGGPVDVGWVDAHVLVFERPEIVEPLAPSSTGTIAFPAAPELATCPVGWRSTPIAVPDPGLVGCAATATVSTNIEACGPALEPVDCDVSELSLPSSGCLAVGSPCPTGEWSEALPTDRALIFVSASGSASGLGTREDPVDTIGSALRLSSPGSVIAIGRGTFVESVRADQAVTLWGVCPRETRIRASSAAGAVFADFGSVTLRDLTLEGAIAARVVGESGRLDAEGIVVSGGRGVLIEAGAMASLRFVLAHELTQEGVVVSAGSIELRSVEVRGARRVGVIVSGAEATAELEDVGVRDTQGDAAGRLGHGFVISGGAHATVRRSLLERNHLTGIGAFDPGTELSLEDVWVQDTESELSSGGGGRALSVASGARVSSLRLVALRSRGTGVLVSGAGTSARLRDTLVVSTRPAVAGAGGTAFRVQERAFLAGARLRAYDSYEAGLAVYGASANVTDVLVDATHGGLAGTFGISVAGTGQLEAARVGITRTVGFALALFDPGSRGRFSDLEVVSSTRAPDRSAVAGVAVLNGAAAEVVRGRVRDVAGDGAVVGGVGTTFRGRDLLLSGACPSGRGAGVGIRGYEGARVEVHRSLFSDLLQAGLLLDGIGTEGRVSDVRVGPIGPDTWDGHGGVGIAVLTSAQLTGERVLIDRATASGLYFSEGTASLSDVRVVDTKSDGRQDFGRGLTAIRGSVVELTRAMFSRNRDASLAVGSSARVVASELRIEDTRPRGCVESACRGNGGGVGASVADGSLTLSRFLIERSAALGVAQVRSELRLQDGAVLDNPVGLNVQGSVLDPEQVADRVVFAGNGKNFETRRLALPDATRSLGL